MRQFVFWQGIVSPHMVALARALVDQGCNVTYVARQLISDARVSQGWLMPDTAGIRLVIVTNEREVASLLNDFPSDVIHLMQGIRGNGYIVTVISALRKRHAHWGAIMETIDERHCLGPLKRLLYAYELYHRASRPDFILAIGVKMPAWVAARGYPRERIFPFTYFLSNPPMITKTIETQPSPFKVGFVGQLIKLKRLDLLINALAGLINQDFELVVVGNGPLKAKLRRQAALILGKERIHFLGTLTMDETRARIASLDCLVLPSDYDGWGAVVSEALMTGVPAICSDACGSATAVLASGVGGVFPKGSVEALSTLLQEMFSVGRISATEHKVLADWARCLGAEAGASYTRKIVEFVYHEGGYPTPAWAE